MPTYKLRDFLFRKYLRYEKEVEGLKMHALIKAIIGDHKGAIDSTNIYIKSLLGIFERQEDLQEKYNKIIKKRGKLIKKEI
jgi:hypothetical protein